MINKTGRNDICSCGSGKKYKKCCLLMSAENNVKEVDFKWVHLRKLEGTLVDNHLLPYVMKVLSRDIISRVFSDLLPEDFSEEADLERLFDYFFVPWFLFNWISEEPLGIRGFDDDITIAENYLNKNGKKITPQEKVFLQAMGRTYYSFYCVSDVELEHSLTVKDILLGTTHLIKEKQGTYHLKRGDIVFSRILTMDDQSIFIGMAPFTIPVNYHGEIIDFRKWLIKEIDVDELTPLDMRDEVDLDILDLFFDIMSSAFNRKMPTLLNTDGDLMQFCTSFFELKLSSEEALARLLPLTLLSDPSSLVQEAKRDDMGNIRHIAFNWLKKGNKKHKEWDNTVMGDIVLEPTKLMLHTNSVERMKKGRKLLEKYLGDFILFKNTLIESPEQKMRSSETFPISTEDDAKEQDALLAIPEVRAQIKAMAQAHWKHWFDEPIPDLDHLTPRQAAKTKDGREKLDALLLQYERYDMKREGDDPFKADIHYLCSELFMD